MAILGSHTSAAGGFYRAVERAAAVGADCVQLFTTPPRQWPVSKSKPVRPGIKTNAPRRAQEIPEAECLKFTDALRQSGVAYPLSHASYLINLGSPDPELWRKSVDAFVVELRRAESLGIPYVVIHPGAYTTSSEALGLAAIVRAVDEVDRQTADLKVGCLLETTAGQGTTLGWRFEHLATVMERVRSPDRLGVCFDTCHVHAAGYGLQRKKEVLATIREFDKVIGLEKLKTLHLNDSKKERGSRVDRHEHIGRGTLGLEPFWCLLNDRRFRKLPMYLETEKGIEDGRDLDRINLETLRSLIGVKSASARTTAAAGTKPRRKRANRYTWT